MYRPMRPILCATIAIGATACISAPVDDDKADPSEISPDLDDGVEVDPEGLDRFRICGPQAVAAFQDCGGIAACVIRRITESWPNPDAVDVVTYCINVGVPRDAPVVVQCVRAATELGRCVRDQVRNKDLDRSTCTPIKGNKQIRCTKKKKTDGGNDSGDNECNDNYHGC